MADILSIGSSGLSAYKRSLEVTGNNIVNANTEGYSRRNVQLTGVGEASATPTSLNNGSGGGVSVELIGRSTDNFVQAQARDASSAASAATALSDRLDRLEKNLFSADTDLGASIQNFFSKIQDLSSTPTSLPIRVTVLQATDSLAADFRAQADKLTQESNAILSDAKDQLNQTNALTTQLAQINKNLVSLGSDPSKTNDLLDQRDNVINKIVKLVHVTVETQTNGSTNLYIGDGTGGPQLVNQSGAKTLSVSRDNGNLSISMDPYGSNTPIGMVSGGTVGGILSFNDYVASSLEQLNRLATGLSTSINAVHTQGIDLQGRKGLPLLSTDNLKVTVPLTNRGTGSATLDITNASSLGSGSYSARFNAAQNTWTVTNDVTKAKASGTSAVSIDGLKINFAGLPVDNDTFTFSPLKDAAAGIHLVIQDPNQLAASLPQLAQNGGFNTGSGVITLNSSGGTVPAPALPALSSIFSHALSPSAALGITRDGAIATIPSGATNVTFSSLGNISAAMFQFDAAQLVQKSPAQLSITVNGNAQQLQLFPDGAPPPVNEKNALTNVIDEINRSLDQANLSDKLFASAFNGNVVINALGSNVVNFAAIQNDAQDSGSKFTTSATIESPAPAADLELLTTEGQQLTGGELNARDQSNIFTSANGFSPEAVYAPVIPTVLTSAVPTMTAFATGELAINGQSIEAATSLSDLVANINKDQVDVTAVLNGDQTIGLSDKHGNPITIAGTSPAAAGFTAGTFSAGPYRGLAIKTTTSPLPPAIITTNADGSQSGQMTVGAVPETDSAWQTASGSPQAGAVYSLAIDGLKPIRIAGDAIVGKDSTAIATALSDKIAAIVPQRTISGSAISLSPTDGMINSNFTITLNGVDYATSFHRATAADGQLLPSGNFAVQGNPDIKITLNDVSGASPPRQTVSISLPKSVSAAAPSVTFSGSGAAALGLSSTTQNIIATQAPAQTATYPQGLQLIVAGTVKTVQITGSAGTDASSGVSWATNNNGQLVLSAAMSSPMLGFATVHAADRDGAASLGFVGTDLTVSKSDGSLTITSSVVDRAINHTLIDTSATVSRIGKSISITGPVPEDLILATKAMAGGARRLTATFKDNIARVNPQMPDVNIRISGPGEIEITDKASGNLLATRNYTTGIPVNYMGAKFQIDGNAAIGDTYSVTTDLARTGDNRNGLKLATLQNADLLGPGSGTFQDIYANEVSKIGASSQAAQTTAASTKTVSDNLTAAFSSATGVNMDTEASNLLQMQQAYQACAQIISTARDMFASILKAF